MKISSIHLQAFEAVAQAGSVSKAAKTLNISQSAFSQRILNLEAQLEASLLVRLPKGVRLTEAGQKLLSYCQAQKNLENEFLNDFSGIDSDSVAGSIRIAGISTAIRSVVLPALKSFLKTRPSVSIEVSVAELSELETKLKTSQVDYIVTYSHIPMGGMARLPLFTEKNVLVESVRKVETDFFLDHDPSDLTTEEFFAIQKKSLQPKVFKRRYFDEIYSIIDGVELGIGRAVVPKHLIKGRKKLRIVSGYQPLEYQVDLAFVRQPYYSKVHKDFIEELTNLLW